MRDKNNVLIEEGAEVIINDGQAKGKIIKGDFKGHVYGEGDDLIADAGFMKMLVTEQNAKLIEVLAA